MTRWQATQTPQLRALRAGQSSAIGFAYQSNVKRDEHMGRWRT